jgi:hypothetical protein
VRKSDGKNCSKVCSQPYRDIADRIGAATTQEDVTWDEDSDNETPNGEIDGSTATIGNKRDTLKAPVTLDKGLKPPRLEPPRPHDVLSQPDSDASYDLVSAATSRAGGSPRDVKTVEEESDEDWE